MVKELMLWEDRQLCEGGEDCGGRPTASVTSVEIGGSHIEFEVDEITTCDDMYRLYALMSMSRTYSYTALEGGTR